MNYFEQIQNLLGIPYPKAVEVITKKDELKQILKEYEEAWEKQKKCIECGRPMERPLTLCPDCLAKAAAAREEYIEFCRERINNNEEG